MTGPGLPPGFLNGVRIIDFSWYAVGPWGPRMLAPYGAEIIHIEPPHQPDDHRFDFRPARGINAKDQKVWHEEGSPPFYTGPYWNQLHNGKLGISLNTRHPEGMRLLHELIKKSDALVENFSGNVLDSWDLTWENLLKLNPKLTYLSTAGFGHKGPWGGFRTFGPSAQAGSGLTYTSGLPGREPAGWGYSHMDIAGGWIGGLGLIMGLLQARRTGKGVRVDYAVTEAAMSLLGTYFLDFQVNGRGTDRPDFPPGNHSEWPGVAPHNTYRCAGIDRQGQDWWVFIAAETQEQFEALCDVMKKPELLTDPRFATNEARVKNQDVLDEIISTWTAPRRRYEVQTALQSVGVIAVAVQGAEDRVDYDPQLRHRGIYPVIQHPEIGEFEIEAFPPKMSRTPPNNTLRSPLIREHTDYVFGELLGMSEAEIADYRTQGII